MNNYIRVFIGTTLTVTTACVLSLGFIYWFDGGLTPESALRIILTWGFMMFFLNALFMSAVWSGKRDRQLRKKLEENIAREFINNEW